MEIAYIRVPHSGTERLDCSILNGTATVIREPTAGHPELD